MWVRKCIAFLFVLLMTGGLLAEAPPAQPDIAELLRRLERAEQQIQELQSQLAQEREKSKQPSKESEKPDEKKESKKPDSSLADRIEKLEKTYEEDKATREQEKAKKPSLDIGGRIHLDYWGHPSSDPGINALERGDPSLTPQERITYRRVRFFMEGEITDNMIYKFETEFGNPNDFEFRDVYIGFTELPFLQTVQIGNQKRPLGFDHWNSSRYTLFLERPFVIEAFNEDARRLGIQSFGYNESQTLNWQFGVFGLEKIQDDGDIRDDHLQMSFNGRIAGTPWYDETSDGRGYLHLGLATMIAHTDGDSPNTDTQFNQAEFSTRPSARTESRWLDTGRIDEAEYYEVLGLEALLNIGAFSLTSEWQCNWVQRDAGLSDLYFHGGYMQLAYWLTGESTPLDRTTGMLDRTEPFEDFFLIKRCTGGVGGGWGAWQIAIRAQYVDLTSDDILGGDGYGTTLALNWWWNSHARMQFNYILGRITDRKPLDDGTPTGGEYSILGWRMMIDF